MAKISDVITKSVSFMLQSGTTLAPFWSGAYFSHSLSLEMTAKDLKQVTKTRFFGEVYPEISKGSE
jgi:hypothetical protein